MTDNYKYGTIGGPYIGLHGGIWFWVRKKNGGKRKVYWGQEK